MKKTCTIFFLILGMACTGFSQTWEKINTGYNYILKCMEFPGGQGQTGYAAGQDLTYMGDGIVIKTTNGGTSWSSLWTGVDQGIEDMSFPDLNTGYVCGWSAYFAKTTNGGSTWVQQTPGSDIYMYTAVAFKDANNGVVTAQTNSSAGVWVTSNGGTTWIQGAGLAAIPYKLVYVSDNTYYLVTNGGHIQKSTDGGLTWTTIKQGLGLLLGIDFLNPMTGMALGEDGWIHKTFDGGATWTPQQTAYGNPLWRDVAWKNQNEVVTCGTPETIWKSLDAGATWSDDYPTSTYNPALYEILFTNDGTGYICGSQGWFYRKLSPFTASFTANNTQICAGGSVQFTDQSVGNPTSWNWTFEGGTPATSTLQNPSITYATPGVYDVTLQITRNTTSNTVVKTDYILTYAPLTTAPAQPTGPTQVCSGQPYQYTTNTVAGAGSYTWSAEPASAGSFSGSGNIVTFNVAAPFSGTFLIKVAANNACGTGPYSTSLSVVSTFQPQVYSVLSGGGYCPGQQGYEIQLEDSDPGVAYQLYKDGVAYGATVTGTGNALSFGLQPVGSYTITGTNGLCSANMAGTAVNFLIPPAGAAIQPMGPTSTCNTSPSLFSASLPANTFLLVWALSPANAGVLTQPTLTTAEVAWDASFAGTATISVQGSNECGTGTASPGLNVAVYPMPQPVVGGPPSVCKNQTGVYSTAPNPGSAYTWIVAGGTITLGQGGATINVDWGSPGSGSVMVTETSATNCTGVSASFPVMISSCDGLAENQDGAINVFPVPAVDQLCILPDLGFQKPAYCSIVDYLGREVLGCELGIRPPGTPYRIDVSNLRAGTYTLLIKNEDRAFNKIFMIAR